MHCGAEQACSYLVFVPAGARGSFACRCGVSLGLCRYCQPWRLHLCALPAGASLGPGAAGKRRRLARCALGLLRQIWKVFYKESESEPSRLLRVQDSSAFAAPGEEVTYLTLQVSSLAEHFG